MNIKKKIDFHVHIMSDLPVEESAYYFKDMCERHGYCGVNIAALSYNFEGCNETCLRLLELMPESYAFGCLEPKGTDYVKQAETLMGSGFSGIKLFLGGKPNFYKTYPHFYEDELYSDFFALCEEKQYPIIMHNNDPAYCWDITKADERAIKMGWIYGDGIPSHQRYFTSAENVLMRYPKLNIALAHMGFYSENIEKAFELMEKYPNLKMDITPALNIYSELSQIPERAEEFFRKYHNRIIFGTDATNKLVGEARAYNDLKNEVTSHFLTGEGERVIGTRKIHAIRLDENMLENIYYNNAMRFIEKAE
ncbi:MAG: amidohydrolase family protein [Clostridia bacterium]|nr:amidohydrolase family protein [Clostridia bacterium]